MTRRRRSSSRILFLALPAIALALIVAVVAAARRDGDTELAQTDGTASGETTEHGTLEPGSAAGIRRLQPETLPTSDRRRWEAPAARMPPLKADRPDEADADVETAHEEAASLRREAAELRATLDRLQAQQKRGARVPTGDTDAMRKRAELLEDQIGDLQHHAQDLDGEAATLQGKDEDASPKDGEAHHTDMGETVTHEVDPLSGDVDDPLDDAEDGELE